MTTLTHTEIQTEEAREYVRHLAYIETNFSPEVEIVGTPKWDADGNMNLAGPLIPTGITGCKAEASVSIPWPSIFDSADARAEAAKGFDEADLLACKCLEAILQHTPPPGGAAEIGEVHEMNWKVTRRSNSLFDAAEGLLTFPVRIVGER